MREVILHGALAELVGTDRLQMQVDGPRDLVRALVVQVPGARAVIEGATWRVIEGDRELDLVGVYVSSRSESRLELVPMLEGSGSGQGGTGKLIAGILLLGAALIIGPLGWVTIPWISPLLIGGIGASLAISGISQLLAPVPAMDYMAPEAAERRQSALFAGASNLLGTGHAIPLAYGETRLGSVQVSSRIVTTDASSGGYLRSVARLQIVDVLSEGEVEGLVTDDEVSILLDDTRVAEASGTVNYQDVEWSLTTGATGDPATITGVESTTPVETEMHNATGDSAGRVAGAVARTISDPNVDFVRVTLRWPQLFAIVPPVTGSIAAAAGDITLEIDSDGGGFIPAGLTGAQIGNSTIAYDTVDDTGAVLVTGIQFAFSPAWADTDDPGATVTFRVSHRVVGAATWTEIVLVRTIDFDFVNDVFVTLPEDLDFVDVGGEVTIIARAFDLPGALLEWKYSCDEGEPSATIGYDSDLGTGWFGNVHTLLGITTSPYERDLVIPNLAAHGPPPWTVRVGKVQLDYADPLTAVNAVFWARYAEGIEREFIYPDVARVTLEVDAEDVGNRIPERLYELQGIKLELPSNLTASTRTYTGVWAGTFAGTKVYYDNPAWVLWDLLRSDRYGLGLAEAEIDKWSIYDAAVWCDELVDDGAGGTHPRFTFNHQFTVREDALRVVQAVASAMQASLWWGSGKLFVTVDKPDDVARHFTNANVIDGVFSYGSPGRAARSTVAKVSWRNPDLGYESDVDLVDRPYAIDRYGRNEVDVLAIGATHLAQARRRGRYEVLSSELEGATVRFAVGAESALLEPGQIIETSDRYREAARYGGRVLAWGAPYLLLDFGWSVSMTGETIRVLLDDGSIHVSAITSTMGGGSPLLDHTFTLDTALPGGRTILVGAPWILTVNARHFWRVLALKPAQNTTFEVEAIAHDPTKQDQIEDFADLGAAIAFPAGVSPSAPTIMTSTAVYDAVEDLWSLEISFLHTSPLAVWALVGAIGDGVAISREATTRELIVLLPLSTHAIVGGFDFDITVAAVTADGTGYSTADTATVSVPAVVP